MMQLDMEILARNRIIDELIRLGVYDTASMESFSDDVLVALLSMFQKSVEKIRDDIPEPRDISKEKSLAHPSLKLNRSDKKILKMLANSRERLSALSLSKELGIPITTVQRRRKRLESEFLEEKYALKYEKFGLRKAILFVSTNAGTTKGIGNKILKEPQVISIARILGKNNMNISSEILFRDNTDLLNIIEKVKSLDGVNNVTWIEMVEVLQTRPDAALNVIEG